MRQYSVTGMSCAACSARVEKAVKKVEGVRQCAVNLLTNSMGVDGTASDSEIIAAVERAGYHAALKENTHIKNENADNAGVKTRPKTLDDSETRAIVKRLLFSIGFLLVLVYFTMGHHMWHWPLPKFFEENPIGTGLLQMLLALIVLAVNRKFFISGFRAVIHGAPNMDTLVALGSGVSFVYSVVILFAMTGAQAVGDVTGVSTYYGELYFESAAMIVTLITVGKMLEAYSKGKTTGALKSLMELAPKTATVLREGQETEIPIEQMRVDELFIVRPGANIPVDGVVIEGISAVDESALTGESIPVDKSAGATVSAGTVNCSGYLQCRSTRVGEDTTLSQIIRMVSDASATKAPVAKVADRVSGIFVPIVLAIAFVTIVAWMIAGQGMGYALARGISVLVISCPCALGLATPVAIMVGNGVAAKNGILFKNATALEMTGKIKTVVLDKTGTITVGIPMVTDVIAVSSGGEEELLSFAASLEEKSEHPLSIAVMKYAKERNAILRDVTDFTAVPGNGLQGQIDGIEVRGGNASFIGKDIITTAIQSRAEELAQAGKTPLYFSRDGKLLGCIAVADVIKEDSPIAIRELEKMGLRVLMLTGDNARTAEAIGKRAGVSEVVADVLPDGKETVVRELQKSGAVAMVGDGINDAPALTRADVGIAIGAGTDVAMDAADIVLMESRLSDVPAAVRLSRATLKNIHQNLFWAFFYNVIGIPLAAGVWIPIFHWEMNPMFGAAAMSLSSICVVMNALRLNLFHARRKEEPATGEQKAGSEIETKISKKEGEKQMKTIRMNITGMMCGHCSARVKSVLEGVTGVESAVVSHEDGTAVITAETGVSSLELKALVEAQDYQVTSVSEDA